MTRIEVARWSRLQGLALVFAIAGISTSAIPATAQVFKKLCKDCITLSDTSSSGGYVSMSRTLLYPASHPPIALIGPDHGLRLAQPTSGGWEIQPVDTTSAIAGVSLERDDLGETMLSYRDGNGLLTWAHRVGSTWAFEIVENAGGGAGVTSLAHIPGGAGIAFHDSASGVLKYAERTSGSWNVVSVTSSGGMSGRHASLVVDGAARAVSYYDAVNGDLRLALTTGGSWTTSLIDGTGDVGGFSSLVGGPSVGGFGVAYFDFSNGDLKYAWQDAGNWLVETVDSDDDVGRHCSAVALDGIASDQIEIAYYDRTNGDLKRARKVGSAWSIDAIATTGDVGGHAVSGLSAASIDTVGTAYVDGDTGDLYYRWQAGTTLAVAGDNHARAMDVRWLPSRGGASGRVRFTLPAAGKTRVTVHDLHGRHVADLLDGELSAGEHEAAWNGRDTGGHAVRSGVFFARIETARGSTAVRAIILR